MQYWKHKKSGKVERIEATILFEHPEKLEELKKIMNELMEKMIGLHTKNQLRNLQKKNKFNNHKSRSRLCHSLERERNGKPT